MNTPDLELLDIRAYLDERGVAWYEAGTKNTSSGWISLSCPFCGDRSNHGAINLSSMKYNCFKCSKKGTALNLIAEIDQCSYNSAIHVVGKFVAKEFSHLFKKERTSAEKTMLPSGIIEEPLPIHLKFLESRDYNPDIVIKKYDLMFVGPTVDKWKFRIIIPIYMNHELVSYVGRDVTGKAEIQYLNCPIEKSILPVKSCLYGIDNVKDTVIITEGIFDMWRIGKPAVCTFGTQFTKDQLCLFKGVKRGYVLFDQDAINQAHKMASDLTSVIPFIEVLELSEGDPDNMDEDSVFNLRKELDV